MKNRIDRGNTIANVVFILAFISFALTLTTSVVLFYLTTASKRVEKNRDWDKYFGVLTEVLDKMKAGVGKVGDNSTSPFSGWFSEMPREKDGFTITYIPEDSKIDINHLDTTLFLKISVSSNDQSSDEIFIKITDKYLYYPEDLKEYINPSVYEAVKDLFSIYNVPAVNTADIERIKMYMKSNDLDESLIEGFTGRIKSYRGSLNYIKFSGTKSKNSGIIIDEFAFEALRSYGFPEDKTLNMLFDNNGMVNVNFVQEKAFEILVKVCGPPNVSYRTYWKKIKDSRDEEVTIEKGDLNTNIFGSDWPRYEKMFSVDSRLFLITISKDDKVLSCIVRRYKENIKILKISANDTN